MDMCKTINLLLRFSLAMAFVVSWQVADAADGEPQRKLRILLVGDAKVKIKGGLGGAFGGFVEPKVELFTFEPCGQSYTSN